MNIPMNSLSCYMVFIILSLGQYSVPSTLQVVPSIEIGKQIYTTGIGSSEQKIMASLAGREISASMMACANCHGKCGKGLSLQGVDIPDIRRLQYVERHLQDVPEITVEKTINARFKKAIALGIKHDGEDIHRMMPRYSMSLDDMTHLLAYLAVLGEEENCSKA